MIAYSYFSHLCNGTALMISFVGSADPGKNITFSTNPSINIVSVSPGQIVIKSTPWRLCNISSLNLPLIREVINLYKIIKIQLLQVIA